MIIDCHWVDAQGAGKGVSVWCESACSQQVHFHLTHTEIESESQTIVFAHITYNTLLSRNELESLFSSIFVSIRIYHISYIISNISNLFRFGMSHFSRVFNFYVKTAGYCLYLFPPLLWELNVDWFCTSVSTCQGPMV